MPRILLAGVIVLAVLMSGCKIGGSKASNAQASLRLLHVAALNNTTGTTTNVNMTVDTTVVITGLTFGSITNYMGYDSGSSHVFQIGLSDGSAILQTDTFVLGASTNYTLVLYGSSTTPGSVLITDTNTLSTTLNSGYFQFRPVHSAISVPQMDLYLIPVPSDPTQLNATFQKSGPTFTSFTITGIPPFQQFPATGQTGTGQYVMFVTSTGSKTILYQSPPITFNPGDIITGDVYSLGSGSLVNMILMYQNTNNTVTPLSNLVSQIKFTNASAVSGSVNEQVISPGGVSVTPFSGVPFGGSSSYAQVTAGADNLAVLNGAGTVATTAVSLQGSGDYSSVLIGNPPQLLVLSDNNLPPSAGDAKVRFVNATSDTETLSVQVNFIAQGTTSLANNQASIYFNIPQNPSPGVTVSVSNAAGLPVLTSPGVEILAGSTYTFYIIGSAGSLQGILSKDN